jgi:hypothetical protein
MKNRWTTALLLACLAFLSWHLTQMFWKVSYHALSKVKHEIYQEQLTPKLSSPHSPTCQIQVEEVRGGREVKIISKAKKKTILIIHRF